MPDGMGREFAYLSSHATNRYFIPNWGIVVSLAATLGQHGPRRGDVPAKLFHYMALFLAMA